MNFKINDLNFSKKKKFTVCVIGAGAAGICSIKNLKEFSDYFEIVAYEFSGSIGGTWVYTDKIGHDENGYQIHSSMYKNLRTNIPLSVMEYPDFSCKKYGEQFVRHEIVLDYLQNYVQHFNIEKYIQFYHRVKLIEKKDHYWNLKILNLKTKEEFEKQFDIIMVCIGRYSKSYIPEYLDLSQFKGLILHSHEYRKPDIFKDENVVILGAGPSGLDIAVELNNNAKNIYLIHNSNNEFSDLNNSIIQIKSEIKQILSNSVILKNGIILENIHKIIFATGYELEFDIFHENVGIKITPEGKITNIYLHLLNSLYPTMCLLAIPQRLLPFPMYHQQICWFIQHILGKLKIPSKEEMDKWSDLDYKNRLKLGLKPKHMHKMVTEDQLWDYEKLICEQAKLPRIKPVIRDIYNNLHKLRNSKAKSYKKTRFYIKNDYEYIMKE